MNRIDVPFIKEYNFRMTNEDFDLDSDRHAVRFCLSNNKDTKKLWLSGYCLFNISSTGLVLFMFVGRGIEPSGESLGIDTDEYNLYKLKVAGIDLI